MNDKRKDEISILLNYYETIKERVDKIEEEMKKFQESRHQTDLVVQDLRNDITYIKTSIAELNESILEERKERQNKSEKLKDTIFGTVVKMVITGLLSGFSSYIIFMLK